MPVKERRMEEQQQIVNTRESDERLEHNVAREVERELIRDEERMRENEHEGDILKKVGD